jgi:hypothetical protein
MAKDAVLEKVKHLSAQVAMDEQPSGILSQGFALCGQQSISSMADISAISVDFIAAPTPPAAGSMATDKAIRSANTVRPTFMARQNSRFGALGVK